MEILKHRSLNSLLDSLKSQGAILSGVNNPDIEKLCLSAPSLLASQLVSYAPNLLKKSAVDILIAGASNNECVNYGEAFRLLNQLIDCNVIKWNLTFIGPDVDRYNNELGISINRELTLDACTSVVFDRLTLEQAIEKYGNPDLVCINHIGLESYYPTWLLNDNTITNLLDNDVPVVGASFGVDEVDSDRYYFSAFGIDLVDDQRNDLYFDVSSLARANEDLELGVSEKEAQTGLINWGQTKWTIRKGVGEDLDKQQRIELMEDLRSSVAMFLHSRGELKDHSELPASLNRNEDGSRIVRICANLSLNLETNELFDEIQKAVVLPNVEIEPNGFDVDNESLFHTSMLMANVFERYVRKLLDLNAAASQAT